jgi:acyl transferase domain-containing protein/acyl carrier protein
MMRPAVAPFTEAVARCRRGRPGIPFLSNLTGTWITSEQAADPSYWALQLVSTVRFGDGLATLLGDPGRVLLEVGPGETLARIARDLPAASGHTVLSTLGSDRFGEPEAARVLAALGGLWAAGVEIDWPAWHGAPRRRVPLPPYPFERRRYWLEAGVRPAAATPASRTASAASPDQEGRRDLEDWFYTPSWKQGQPLLPTAERPAGREEPWLVLCDRSGGVGEALAAELSRRFDRVVRVMSGEPGGDLRQISEREYALDPAAPQGFERLLDELRKAGLAPRYAVHAWQAPAHQSGADPAERFVRSQETGLHALLDLVRAWQDGGPLDLFLVTDRLFDVTGDEALRPEQATLAAAGIVVPQEYAGVRCRTIDVDAAGAADPAFAARLARELLATGPSSVVPPVVALRGRHRWLQSFEPLRLSAAAGGPLREGGVYLITGGLGGLGRVIAGALFERVRARLVLVGRTGLPAASGEDPVAEERIQAVRDLESRGAEVLVLQADVSRTDEVATALEEARRRFGAVHGVIHAAGVPGAGLIQLKTREMIDAVFAPKVLGALALDAACARLGLDLDFLACFSSNASVTGAVGQVDYCAANAFLDAFAHDRTRSGRPTLTIDWDWWQSDTWQEASLQSLPELQGRLKLMRQMYGIRIEEGLEAFWRLLASPVPQVVVSTKDLHTTIFKHSRMMAEIEHAVAPAGRERPLPADTYVAPRNEMEERIARIWQEGLGIDRIGVQDNFFALGGHSLLAVRLISELRKAFQIEITMDLLIQEAPTVAGLAEAIVARQLASADDAELSAALAELGELSDEEVRLLLAGELGGEGA